MKSLKEHTRFAKMKVSGILKKLKSSKKSEKFSPSNLIVDIATVAQITTTDSEATSSSSKLHSYHRSEQSQDCDVPHFTSNQKLCWEPCLTLAAEEQPPSSLRELIIPKASPAELERVYLPPPSRINPVFYFPNLVASEYTQTAFQVANARTSNGLIGGNPITNPTVRSPQSTFKSTENLHRTPVYAYTANTEALHATPFTQRLNKDLVGRKHPKFAASDEKRHFGVSPYGLPFFLHRGEPMLQRPLATGTLPTCHGTPCLPTTCHGVAQPHFHHGNTFPGDRAHFSTQRHNIAGYPGAPQPLEMKGPSVPRAALRDMSNTSGTVQGERQPPFIALQQSSGSAFERYGDFPKDGFEDMKDAREHPTTKRARGTAGDSCAGLSIKFCSSSSPVIVARSHTSQVSMDCVPEEWEDEDSRVGDVMDSIRESVSWSCLDEWLLNDSEGVDCTDN